MSEQQQSLNNGSNARYQNLSDSQQIQGNGSKDMSEWMAKKNLQQSEKQIDLIMNRINLLKKEQDKTAKRIDDTKKKTDRVIDMKRRNQEMNMQKNNSKQNDGDYLKLLQRKSYEMRRQQEEEREAIRNALIEMKKEETNQVKKLRELNNRKIQEIKNQHAQANKDRHDRVKGLETESKLNIERYWTNHMDAIAKKQDEQKSSHLKEKQQKDLILQRLEKQELDLISSLEQSQTVQYQAQRELEEIEQMPNHQVLEKYPPQNDKQNATKGEKNLNSSRGYPINPKGNNNTTIDNNSSVLSNEETSKNKENAVNNNQNNNE